MRRRMSSHAWVLLSIVILAVATTVALWRVQNNFDDHETIDRQSCQRALKNRELLHETVRALADDRGARTSATQAKLARIDDELTALIASVHECA